MWTSLVSAYCTLSVTSYSAYLRDGPRQLQLHSHVIARSSRATLVKLECIVVGSQWTTMTRVRVILQFYLMALCHSQVTLMLCTDINITETTYSCQFQYEFGNQ